MLRLIFLVLFELVFGVTPAAAKVKRATVVPLTAKGADAETRAFADQLSVELRRLVSARFGTYRLAVADPDPSLVRKLPDCRPEVKCLVAIGTGTNADHVIYGAVRRKAPGFLVRLVLVDVRKRQYVRALSAVMWQDATDVTTFRAWVRQHYAKLLGSRGAHSS
jgi:TolB-like protein